MNPIQYARSGREYARQYGAATRTVRKWKLEGAPLDDPAAMKAWLSTRKNVPASQRDPDIEAAKLKKVLLECDRLDRLNKQAMGELVPIAQVQSDLLRIESAQRAALLTLKADCPTWEGLSAAEIERRVDARIKEICLMLSNAANPIYGIPATA